MSKRKLLKSFSFLFSLKNVEKSLGLVYLVDNLFSLNFFFIINQIKKFCVYFFPLLLFYLSIFQIF